ncbi:MAG: FlaD/FlaE family flagellar protein [Methanolobus sp.]|nr:FlaD/FlaE family flagellar protein [Methanolobus sp.]
MSEFPWEVKKDSSKESSNKDESGPDKPGIAGNMGTGPSISDILANAFAGASMEEIKLEPLTSSGGKGGQNTPSNPPDFGNLADISALVSNNVRTNSGTPSQPAGDMPSFLKAGGAVGEDSNNSGNVSSSSFNIDEIVFNPPAFNPSRAETSIPKKAARKSPPPLFMPVLPGEEPPQSGADEIPVEFSGVSIGNMPSVGPISHTVPGQSPTYDMPLKDSFPSQEETLQAKIPDFGNPFSEKSPSLDGPFSQAFTPENPISGPMATFNGRLPDYVEPSVNPFSDPSAIPKDLQQDPVPFNDIPFSPPFGSPEGTMPDHVKDLVSSFPDSVPPSANPFPDSAPQSVDPFPATVQGSVNPFPDSVQSSMPPFPDSVLKSDNPFSSPASQTSSPFPGFPPNSGSPISGQGPAVGRHTSPSDLIGSIGASIKVDKILRNFDGVGVKVKSLLTGLTKGQSLIERMQDLSDVGSDPVGQKGPSPFDEGSPFNMPFQAIESQSPGPASPPAEVPAARTIDTAGITEDDGVSPFTGSMEKPISEDIRKIIPVTEPLMELKEEQRIDFSTPEQSDNLEVPAFSPGDVISRTIHVVDQEKEKSSGNPVEGLPATDIGGLQDVQGITEDSPFAEESAQTGISAHTGTLPEDEIARMGQVSSDIRGIRAELEGMLSRFENVEGNVSDLSDTVSGFGPLLFPGKENEELLTGTATKVDSLDGKVDALEGKVSGIESALVSVQSDNEDIRSGLARIEENIAELVSSYTALLVQVHESAQETDSRFSRIEGTLEVLEPLGSRFSAIEKIHEEARSTSMELARSVSSLVDELGTTSSGLDEFRESCELRQDKLEKNIGSVTEYLDSELKKLGARSYKGFGQNVHLSNIMKNSSNMKLCMEWLEFLMGLVGRNNLPDILSYYEELGWITEEIRSELLHYAEGIDFYMEKPDWKLTPDDHVKSIWFIESLAGMKVDKNRLSVIDRDIEKVKKGTEIYGI